MKIATSTLFACAVALASARSAVAQEPPAKLTPDDFAYAIELTPRGTDPVQTLLVPLAVYRSALRPDLGDVRVFNAAEQVLPHALRKLDPPAPVDQPVAERERTLPLFPLFAPVDAPAAALDALASPLQRASSPTSSMRRRSIAR